MVMEALSRLMEKAVDQGQIRLHPKCSDPQVSHLLFADDLLVFSDGSRQSLSGILSAMEEFKRMSGLDMNHAKSELFFGGYLDIQKAVLSDLYGIKLGEFPTRYLGLPLKPGCISLATLQPFIDQITDKLHSWTMKFLSFAGKVQLITSVIYGNVNFWSSVFVLPKSFYAKIDSLCSAFLWRNKTDSGRGDRVAWKDICKPKMEGGSGRLLEDCELIFRLKHAWSLFTKNDSLWVTWLKSNMFHRKPFWLMEDSPRLSKSVRSLVQLKDSLKKFMRCEIRNRQTALFWFDHWNELDPLITYVGAAGPRLLRLRLEVNVSESTRDGLWNFLAARTPQIEQLQVVMTNHNFT